MSVTVPNDYNVADEQHLDVFEQTVRALPGIDLNNWGKFRIAIHTGTERRSLHFTSNQNGQPLCPVPTDAVDDAYVETGKAHHEIVRSMYFMTIARNEAAQHHAQMFQADQLLFPAYGLFLKAVKDFYFHSGALLDNFGRLIYIFNDSAAAATTLQEIKKRRRINWGGVVAMNNSVTPPVRQNAYANNYITTGNEDRLEGIKNVRNLLTHSWKLPEHVFQHDLAWPENVRDDEDFGWWHEDPQLLQDVENGVVGSISIMQTISEDYQFLIEFQSEAFEQLRHDIGLFEGRYHVVIRNVLRT